MNPSSPEPEEIRAALEELLHSRSFANAGRHSRFIKYVVERTLLGEQDQIKELSIALDVFERGADFDPRLDTVVRVEAGKLRKRIEEHYSADGAGAVLRIEIPKGTYIPVFHRVVKAAKPGWLQRRGLVLLVAALALGLACWAALRLRPPPRVASVAVLPFENLSTEAQSDYFAQGLTEDLIEAFGRGGVLRVASRTSAIAVQNKALDVKEMGRLLNVEHLLEGSVRREAGRLKVAVKLVRSEDGFLEWSQSFDRGFTEVLAVQREIAESVRASIEPRLTGTVAPRTNSPLAFDLYLKARFLSEQFSPADFEKAESFYREALKVDGRYAQARQGLAELLVKMNILGVRSPATTVDEARRQLELAVEVDPSMSAAYATRGSLLARHFYQWDSAERDFRKALTLDPHNAMAHNLLAQDVLAPQGRFVEAFSEQKLARDLDSVSEWLAMGHPFLLILARQNAEALDLIQAGLRRKPGDPGWIGINANALTAVGKFSAALEQYQRLQQMTPSPQISGFMGAIEAKMGNPAAARIRLQQLDAMSRTVYITPLSYALIEAELGMLDQAFLHLEQGRQNRESALIFSKIGQHMDPLRKDPRYQLLLTELGLQGSK